MISLACFSCSSAGKSSEYVKLFEILTYGSKSWTATDFGDFPTQSEKALLTAHTPHLYIKNDSCWPMDFYKQYSALLFTKTKNGEVVVGDRNNLKRFERDFDQKWELKEKPTCIENKQPPLYAYSWQENMPLGNGKTEKIKILKYSFIFDKSGLPMNLSFWQQPVRLLGSIENWHHLDMHGSVFYLINKEGKLFAILLAQHNHFRSYIVGKDISLEEAKNICFSVRSNEPYLCKRPHKVPTAPTFEDIEWVVAEKNRPFFGAMDELPLLAQRVEVDYHLEFLASKDPLITSWVSLGPEIKIWNLFSNSFRDSPPGMAIYNTPKLKEVWKTAKYFYFDADDESTFKLHNIHAKGYLNPRLAEVFNINSKRYDSSLAELKLKRDTASASH